MTILVTFNKMITIAWFQENSAFKNNWATHQRPMIISPALVSSSYIKAVYPTISVNIMAASLRLGSDGIQYLLNIWMWLYKTKIWRYIFD